MSLGDRYRQNYEYYLRLSGPILLISGCVGFYFPFAWLRRRGYRPEDVKALIGAIRRVFSALLFARIFFGGWVAATDSVMSLVPEEGSSFLRTIYSMLIPVVTAAGFAAGTWVAERLGGTRKTRFSRMFVWPLVGCAVGAAAIFLIGPLMFTLGTGSVVLSEVLAGKRATDRG